MALTLTTNPVTGTKQLFAGLQAIEFVFKREDLAIVDIESGAGGITINVTTDLTSYLLPGDSVYVYSEGDSYIYDAVGQIIAITATEITINVAFIEVATGGYINYLKNYYVELQTVDETFPDANLLPFSLQSDGDAAGNISIDVSIVNDLNTLETSIAQRHITESRKEFQVQYKPVYEGSVETFTLVSGKLLIVLYCCETPENEEILNGFDMPKIFLGYPAALVVAHEAGAASSTIEMQYRELDANQDEITTGTLGTLDNDVNGFLMWKVPESIALNAQTKYMEFDFEFESEFDFKAIDFNYPDFLTQ
jgi:hypothetical protein